MISVPPPEVESVAFARPKTIPHKIYVSQAVVDSTLKHFKEIGKKGHEAAALWWGFYFTSRHDGTTNELTNCMILGSYFSPYIEASGVSVAFNTDEIHRYVQTVTQIRTIDLSMFHICMVHTHPGQAFHSGIDNNSLKTFGKGSLSLVIPNFAKETQLFGNDSKCYYNGDSEIEEIHNYASIFEIVNDVTTLPLTIQPPPMDEFMDVLKQFLQWQLKGLQIVHTNLSQQEQQNQKGIIEANTTLLKEIQQEILALKQEIKILQQKFTPNPPSLDEKDKKPGGG